MHRNTDVFGPDAHVFRPERWFDVPAPRLRRMEQSAELVFGYGRFKCLGQAIAMMELNKIYVEVCWLSRSRQTRQAEQLIKLL